MSELLNIYELFAGYAKDGLEIVSLPIEKDAVFEKAIANCSNIDESLAQKISAVTSRLTVGVRVDDYEGRYNHLVHCAQEAAAKIDKQAYKSALEEFLNTIEEEDAMVEGVAEYRDGAKKDLSLRGVDWNRVYQAIIKQPNPKACMIIDSVNHMIGKDAQTWSQVEYRALDAFRADLQRFAREHKSLPRIVSIWRLVKSIQQFLKGVGVY